MYMLHGFKSTQNRFRIILKVEKVLYSRAFFNASSGAENVLKTYFVFGDLTKGFYKGPKLTLFQKFRQKSRKLTAF